MLFYALFKIESITEKLKKQTMDKKLLTAAALAATLIATAAKKGDDPTLMTVNGKDVKLSEFEYLYKKNNSQQLQPQTLDEYVDMFVTYKLKVADAEAAGIDTTAAFKKEFGGYRDELARPYLRDAAVEDSIIAATYKNMQEEVDVSHIMIALEHTPERIAERRAFLDSLRSEILAGRADFAELADKYSIDPAVKRNHGHMGYIVPNRFPYAFEEAAYATPIGEISPVVTTPFGYHIVKVSGRRPARGTVLAQHILKLTPRDASPEVVAEKQAQMDSIYTLLMAGADFSDMAMRESEDPGSARKGGMLPWFGPGEMVPEFETVAFALANDSISKPFTTSYGVHIIHRIDGREVQPLDQVRSEILGAMARDDRGSMADRRRYDELRKMYNAQIVRSTRDMVIDAIKANNGIDSIIIDRYAGDPTPIVVVADKPIPLSDIMKGLRRSKRRQSVDASIDTFDKIVENKMRQATLDHEKSQLENKYPDFRNLSNEYRDGMLLFEISNRNVWDRASQDKEGLEAYFNANRDRYKWESPKYKGFVVYTAGDSVKNAVNEFLAEKKPEADSVTRVLKGQFGRDIKVERVIVAKGENPVVDFVAFDGPTPELTGKWTGYVIYQGKLIDSPEESADVRGQVTSDYQAQLEKEWVKALRSKYKWKINNKVLKRVK